MAIKHLAQVPPGAFETDEQVATFRQGFEAGVNACGKVIVERCNKCHAKAMRNERGGAFCPSCGSRWIVEALEDPDLDFPECKETA